MTMQAKTDESTQRKTVMAQYQALVDEIDKDVDQLRRQRGSSPCPSNCFDCCRNTATIPISEVEGQYLKEGLSRLPSEVRTHILKKATRSIRKLEQSGYTDDKITLNVGMEAIEAVKGKPAGECPMLIGGVCSVYAHRPVICRVWGYPINNGNELACCRKTFIGQRRQFKPIDYHRYWRASRDLSEQLGAQQKTPNCYLVARLLTQIDK